MAIPSLNELELLHSRICHAVADPKRIQLLYALAEKPCSVNYLAEILAMPQPTVSRHLAILRQQALVDTKREGKSIIYSLADPRMIEVLDTMRLMLRRALERSSERLDEAPMMEAP